MFTKVFSDMCMTYSSIWMNENQVYLHLFVYIATIIVTPHMTRKIRNVMPVECSPILVSS